MGRKSWKVGSGGGIEPPTLGLSIRPTLRAFSTIQLRNSTINYNLPPLQSDLSLQRLTSVSSDLRRVT